MTPVPADPSKRQGDILVIDDDHELCTLIKEYLEPLGYHVSAEHDGAAGLERAAAAKFHAVRRPAARS